MYDNAEDPDLIRDYWPLAGRGQSIITTRNPVFSFELADRGMEVGSWDNDTALKFLLHLLSADISTSLEGSEFTSAQELSDQLSWHALAISTLTGLIQRRDVSVFELAKFYQHRSDVGISGGRSIDALWEIAFSSLDAHSHAILAVMSFVDPDRIPQALFEPDSPAHLPASLSFCSDPLR